MPSRRPPRRRDRLPSLGVGGASARALQAGHPWVIADRQTGSTQRLKAGQLIHIVGPDRKPLMTAIADPDSRIVARVIGPPNTTFSPGSLAREALARRSTLLDDGSTDVLRLVHGEADGLPALHVDQYGSALVALRHAPAAAAYCQEVYGVLMEATGAHILWEKDHFQDLRKEPVVGRLLRGDASEDTEVLVRERGLRYHTRPFDGLATGFYADQRANRQLLSQRGPFPRVLNLFGYTGAFSVAMLAAGAGHAIDVDLAGPALRIARTNVQTNGLAEEHYRYHRGDAIKYVRRAADASFDLVVLDPPTAAKGAAGWSSRTGYDRLLGEVIRLVSPGGTLLACLNDRRARPGILRRTLPEQARARQRRITDLTEAPPSLDFPELPGFPESRSFQGVIARFA